MGRLLASRCSRASTSARGIGSASAVERPSVEDAGASDAAAPTSGRVDVVSSMALRALGDGVDDEGALEDGVDEEGVLEDVASSIEWTRSMRD